MPTSTNADSCLRCGGALGDGFLLERGRNTSHAVRWVSGAPDRGFFGMRLAGRQILEVEARRCRSCGWLDLSAPKCD